MNEWEEGFADGIRFILLELKEIEKKHPGVKVKIKRLIEIIECKKI